MTCFTYIARSARMSLGVLDVCVALVGWLMENWTESSTINNTYRCVYEVYSHCDPQHRNIFTRVFSRLACVTDVAGDACTLAIFIAAGLQLPRSVVWQ